MDLTPLHWCGAVTVETRDALGRTRLRCPDCQGVGEAGASQPTRSLVTRPEHRPSEPTEKPRVPALLLEIRALVLGAPDDPIHARRANRMGRRCEVCRQAVPLDADLPLCDDCCSADTRRKRRDARRAEAQAIADDVMARRTVIRDSGGAA